MLKGYKCIAIEYTFMEQEQCLPDKKTIHVRIPESTWKGILTRAKTNGESASSEVRRILNKEFSGTGTTGGDSIE
ncbi:MAG: hypothetical protein LUQ09_07700 [Methanomassiliicoccales archaeon]|nr:hypothetical protein [Methanomassiliicoccales archaeon]